MGLRWVCGAMLAVAAAAWPADAQEAGKQLSDRSIKALLGLTWSKMPERCVTDWGASIPFDKTGKSADDIIPMETARAAITAGYRQGAAIECGLDPEAELNACLYLGRESKANNWSPQQMAFIGMLFFRTAEVVLSNLEKVDGQIKLTPRPPNCDAAKKASTQKAIMHMIEAPNPLGGRSSCMKSAYPYCREAQPPPALQLLPPSLQ
jgi:hypothetical protein